MKSAKTNEVIQALERELAAALLKNDSATVDRILAEEYVEITSQGALRNKKDVLAIVSARASAPAAIKAGPEVSVEDTKLTDYGNVAVLIGVMTTRYPHMQYQTSPLPGQDPASVQQERFTKVYAKRGDKWQLVASHSTAIVAR